MQEQATEHSAQAAPPSDKPQAPARPSFWARGPVIVVGSIIVSFLLFFGLKHFAHSFTHESTDDAFLDGIIVSVAPKVAGQVQGVIVKNNQQVKAGELLVQIDPRDLEVQFEQKRAASDAAKANTALLKASLDLLTAQINTADATARQNRSEAESAKAGADKASADLTRAEELRRQKILSAEEYDTAKANALATTANLKAAELKAVSAESHVAEVQAELEAGRRAFERGQAQTHQADLDTQAAQLNLSYARIVAPDDGYVTHKAVEEGDYVQVGQRLMALVTSRLWITANFKETQLKKIRVGQPVSIEVDAVPGRTYSGHVESIQAGSGARFSLLPPENAVGNYVKVVQRVPVRISFDGLITAQHVLGPGMSTVPSIRVSNRQIPSFILLLLAVGLALGLGVLWNGLARKKRRANSG